MDVRWNSTYLMLHRLLEQKNAVNLYSIEYGKVDTLSSNEWDIIKNLTTALKFFYEATLDLSFDDASISIVIPLISLLTRTLQVRSENENEIMINMKNSLYDSLNTRFSYIKRQTSLMAATILNPRFKSKHLNSDELDLAMSEIISFLTDYNNNSALFRGTDNVSLMSTAPFVLSTSTSNIQQDKEGLWDSHDNTPNQMESAGSEDQKTVLKEKSQNNLSEPLRVLQRNADIYCYWNSSPYLTLRKAVLKYLSASPTSVPSKQLFSAAGQIYTDRRNNLLGEKVEKLLLSVYNIRVFSYEY
ncbi:unnamed protein product [Parnassius mnemosyne]